MELSTGTIMLKSFLILSMFSQHSDLPDGSEIVIQIAVDGKMVKQTEPVGARKSVWRFKGDPFILDEKIRSFQLLVIHLHPDLGEQYLASFDLTRQEIIRLWMKHKTSIDWKFAEESLLLEMKFSLSPELQASLKSVDSQEVSVKPQDLAVELQDLSVKPQDVTLNTTVPQEMVSDNLASVLQEMKELSGSPQLLDAKYLDLIYQKIIAHPHMDQRLEALNNFGVVLSNAQNIVSLDCAISVYKHILTLVPNDLHCMTELGSLCFQSFHQCGDIINLGQSIASRKGLVDILADGHPDKINGFCNLADSCMARFNLIGDISDVDMAIKSYESALNCIPDGGIEQHNILRHLANSMSARFESSREVGDIKKAIFIFEDLVKIIESNNSVQIKDLNSLGDLLLAHFKQMGDHNNIETAIHLFKQAVDLSGENHTDKLACLYNLGRAYSSHHLQFGDIKDIKKSIAAFEAALEISPDDHALKPFILINLGKSFLSQFECLGDFSDIDKSIMIHEKALNIIPYGHPNQPGTMSNLSSLFLRRFEHHGKFLDIDKSIDLLQDAIKLTFDFDMGKPSYLANLSNSLLCRFELFHDAKDLDLSITAIEEALQLTPDGHNDKPGFLNSLGNSLMTQFYTLRDSSNIQRANIALEEAIKLTPKGHRNRPKYLNTYSSVLQEQFNENGDFKYLDQAIQIQEEAVELTADTHPEKEAYLGGLGSLLLRSFINTKKQQYLEKSIAALQNALKIIPESHSNKGNHLNNLGLAYFETFKSFHGSSALNESIKNLSAAAYSKESSPSMRFRAASNWAECLKHTKQLSALEPYTVALGLLPRLAWFGLPMQSQYQGLMNTENIVRNAVSVAIQTGELVTAVEWMEQGHSVVWSQFLQLHTPIAELEKLQPTLAQQLLQTVHKLENTSIGRATDERAYGSDMSSEEKAHEHRKLAMEWEILVDKVRTIPNFENFLLPKKFSYLKLAARTGYVIILNVSSSQCDAIALTPSSELLHVSLINFTQKDAQRLQNSLNNIVKQSGRSIQLDRSGRLATNMRNVDYEFEVLLGELWKLVVKPVVDALGLKMLPFQDLPRIWWCPAGPLAFLPIHAAGIYNQSKNQSLKLSDFAVSSYAPTLSTLIEKSKANELNSNPSQEAAPFKLLAVAQPFTSGQIPLPGTMEEIKKIQRHAGTLSVSILKESEATVKNVTEGMKEANWVHFACHGVQDTENPTESGLILSDGSRLTLSEMSQLSLPHSYLAFLSACQTATGAKNLSEEAVHLASGMLLAGYHGIIATMWSITDSDAPCVADHVYRYLFKDQNPDYTQAAAALHYAIQTLCETGSIPYLSWVPFIHVGV